MLEPAIVVPGPRNNTLYNFKVTARQRVISCDILCGVWSVAWRNTLITSIVCWRPWPYHDWSCCYQWQWPCSRTWLLSLLFIYPPLHIFIFRLLNTFNTHLLPFRFTTLWLLLDVFCYFDVNVWREHIVEVKISLKWIWKRLFQCFSSFIDKLVGW